MYAKGGEDHQLGKGVSSITLNCVVTLPSTVLSVSPQISLLAAEPHDLPHHLWTISGTY